MSVEEKREASKASKKVGRQERNVQSVSADAPSKVGAATRAANPRGQPPQQVQNPAKVGKANPKRDIPIFLGFVCLLFLIAYATSGIGSTKELEKKKSVKQLQEDVRRSMEAAHVKEQARKRATECGLFLASSSIPGAGLGIFAGKRFEIGDEVVSALLCSSCAPLDNKL